MPGRARAGDGAGGDRGVRAFASGRARDAFNAEERESAAATIARASMTWQHPSSPMEPELVREMRATERGRAFHERRVDAWCVSIQTFFTHRPVSTFDHIPFQLTGELFL